MRATILVFFLYYLLHEFFLILINRFQFHRIFFNTDDSLRRILFNTHDSLRRILFNTNDSFRQFFFNTGDSFRRTLFNTGDRFDSFVSPILLNIGGSFARVDVPRDRGSSLWAFVASTGRSHNSLGGWPDTDGIWPTRCPFGRGPA